jgi:hypothetical protein
MIVDQRGANARNLVCTHRRSHAAATYCHAAFDLPRRHSPAERGNKVRKIVVRAQDIRAEIDNLMAGRTELRDQFLFQAEPAVISSDADAHVVVSCLVT